MYSLPSIQDWAILLTISVLVATAIYRQFKAFSFWSSRGVKGPTPWPLFGTNIYYMFKHRIQVDQEWSLRYGKTYGVYEGYWPALRTSDAELIRHVFISNFSNFTDRNSKNINSSNMRRWLVFLEGEQWSHQRSLTTGIFTVSKLKSMHGKIVDCVERFTNEIQSRFKVKSEENTIKDKIVCSPDQLMSLSLDVAATSLFSIKLDTYRDKTSEFYKKAFAFSNFNFLWFIFWKIVPAPIARYLEIDMFKHSQYEFFEKLSLKTVHEHRKGQRTNKNDFIQALIESEIPNAQGSQMTSVSDGQPLRLTDEDIMSQMTFLFLAGWDTTSNSLSHCFYILANLPQIQEELYEELALQRDLVLDHDNLIRLKKLDAFVAEVMRYHSPVLEIHRVVTAKDGVELPVHPPIKLPQGISVVANSYVTHRDPDYWPTPDLFDMSRFHPKNRDKIVSGSYMPFGLGPRNCAGLRFALLTIKTVLAKSLLKYRFCAKTKVHPKDMFKKHLVFLQLKNPEVYVELRQ